jgi:hypothetical protein
MGTSGHQLGLDGIRGAHGHRENCAMQGPAHIAVLNGKRIDFLAWQPSVCLLHFL